MLHFDPCLPDELQRLTNQLRYRRQILDLEVDQTTLRMSSRPFTAAPVTVGYRGHFREISPGQSYAFRLIKPRSQRAPCAPLRVAPATDGNA